MMNHGGVSDTGTDDRTNGRQHAVSGWESLFGGLIDMAGSVSRRFRDAAAEAAMASVTLG